MKPDIKDREYMYRLIIGQLFYDGHQQIAVNLANTLGCSAPAPPPSDKLFRLVSIAKQFVEESDYNGDDNKANLFETISSGLDLEYDADVQPTSPELSEYETVYMTLHKAACRASAFNLDGSLVATGSADCSIKIMDVERILARDKEHRDRDNENGPDAHHPVIRTLYDHVDDVNTVVFHPRDAILISGSNDKTVKLFDFSKTAVKRSMKSLVVCYLNIL
uniref:Cleavage stimulation factor 50 kDa subunit n=1 Tax=Caenorhabditis japonica TaxID=281687 RepID=A0A8R1ICH0_CAEJA